MPLSTWVREHPNDVNRAMDHVAERLRSFGVPVTMHEPNLYLSLPGKARVEAGGRTFRAKPPAYCVDARNGFEGELVYIGANQADDIDTIFDKKLDRKGAQQARAKGKIVISEGYASPGLVSQFEELGAVGVIAVNPGVDIHWGICTTVWGTPDLDDLPRKPKIPAVAVNNPDGKALIELAKRRRQGQRSSPKWKKAGSSPSSRSSRSRALRSPTSSCSCTAISTAGTSALATTPSATPPCSRSRACCGSTADKLARSVRIAWWPGHSTGRYAGSTWFADTFAIDLEENCVAQVNCDSPGCRWATEFTDLSRMSETETFISEVIQDVANKKADGERPHRAGDYSFNNIGISSYFMLSSTMTPREAQPRWATTRSAAAAPTSRGTPRTTRSRSPTRTSCCATSRSISPRSSATPMPRFCRSTGA